MPSQEEFRKHIDEGYAIKGDFITMGAAILDGKALTDSLVKIPLKTMNRHGLIAGATGTGKDENLAGTGRKPIRKRGSRIIDGFKRRFERIGPT